MESLPDDIEEMVRELAVASCELPLVDAEWPWSTSDRAAWVEACDERLAEPPDALRASIQTLALMLAAEESWVTASAPIERESGRLSLGPEAVHRQPRAPGLEPLPRWVVDLGVPRCAARPRMSDVIAVEVDTHDRFQVTTFSGETHRGLDEPALRRTLEELLRRAPDTLIRVPFELCHASAVSTERQRQAWASTSAAARVVAEVAGRPVVPCCP